MPKKAKKIDMKALKEVVRKVVQYRPPRKAKKPDKGTA